MTSYRATAPNCIGCMYIRVLMSSFNILVKFRDNWLQCLSLLDANPFLGSLKRGSFVVVNKNTDGKIIVHSEEEEEHKSMDNVSEAKDVFRCDSISWNWSVGGLVGWWVMLFENSMKYTIIKDMITSIDQPRTNEYCTSAVLLPCTNQLTWND